MILALECFSDLPTASILTRCLHVFVCAFFLLYSYMQQLPNIKRYYADKDASYLCAFINCHSLKKV